MTIIVLDRNFMYADAQCTSGNNTFEITTKIYRIGEQAVVAAAGSHLTPYALEYILDGHLGTLRKPTFNKLGKLTKQLQDVVTTTNSSDTSLMIVTNDHAMMINTYSKAPMRLEYRYRVEPTVWCIGSGVSVFRRCVSNYVDIREALTASIETGQHCGSRLDVLNLDYLRDFK